MGTVAECPPQTPQQDPRLPLAEKEITDLKAQVNRLKKEALAQTKQSQELQLQLAERHSRILQLQLALDQAVQEVVRAKARLRSRNSKAETVACRVPCDYITGSRKTWRKHNAMVIHPQARTTPKLRAEIKAQRDRKQVDLAKQYNVTPQTIRKWQNRDEFTDAASHGERSEGW